MKDLRFLFVVIYLVVDVLYVTISKSYYEKVATKIQGKGFPSLNWSRILAIVVSYGAMIVGWLFLVVPALHNYVENGVAPWKAGLIAGGLYALLVYGVFNGTNHVMFQNWDVGVSVRDLAWGVSWGTTLTVLYAYVSYNYKK